MTVALIDYGAGNLRSVANALAAVGCAAVVTEDPDLLLSADRIVLPGVGAFAAAMAALRARQGLVEALDEAVRGLGVPFLGVCVGMQLMAEWGEEHGRTAGLGWVPGTVAPLLPTADARVPHMGWNDVVPTAGGAPLIERGEAYFLHGYAYRGDGLEVVAVTDHGGPIVAAVASATAIGVQFHPEKSGAYGLSFLSRFLQWSP